MNLDFRVAVACIALLFLVAGSAFGARGDRTVEVGMTTEEVRKMLGRPVRKQKKAPDEAWLYMNEVGTSASVRRCEHATLWFRDGVVRGITTDYGGVGEYCESFGRVSRPRIDWDAMPE